MKRENTEEYMKIRGSKWEYKRRQDNTGRTKGTVADTGRRCTGITGKISTGKHVGRENTGKKTGKHDRK